MMKMISDDEIIANNNKEDCMNDIIHIIIYIKFIIIILYVTT